MTKIAETPAERRVAQHLRYCVFIAEGGGDGPLVDHGAQLDCDKYDSHADHVLLYDLARPDKGQPIGTTRVMTAPMADRAGQFYTQSQYDLRPLLDSGTPLLELGRSCLLPAYRGGPGMWHLWRALAAYARARDIGMLFGVASFSGTDAAALAGSLQVLHDRHLAPPHLRVQAIGPTALDMDSKISYDYDRVAAVRAIPALIKAYLRLGGCVGQGAFVDHAFNTVDICMILQTDALSPSQARLLAQDPAHG